MVRLGSQTGEVRTRLLLLAATATFTVWLTYRALVTSAQGQRLDQLAMVESMAAAPPGTGHHDHLSHLRHVVSVPSIAVAVIVLVTIAVKRSSAELGVAAAATVVGANVTTQALKRWLDRPDLLGLGGANSFPSGHVTVIASLAAGALLVSARRAQPTVAVAGVAATAVAAAATLALGWHRPSDIVGAVGVVAAWAAVAGAWAAGKASRPPPSSRRAAVRLVA
jgi:membrane-associated phospholipid phosphatase